jgi:hypothetical protein
MTFNAGKPYHGSEAVQGGELKGKTGRSDYFFFLCPRCADERTLRILEYEFREPAAPVARIETKKPTEYFNLAFRLYCPKCQFEDFVKIDNNHRAEPLSPQ